VLSAGGDGTVRVWDAQAGELVHVLQGHEGPVWHAAYSPDGTRVLSAGDDGTVRVWDAQSGEPVHVLQGHGNWVSHAAYSPDGTRVLSAGDDGTVRVWDAQTGACLWCCAGFADGWFSIDWRDDRRGRWRGAGSGPDRLVYRDESEQPRPAPWIRRYWRASDLPELAADE